MTIHRLTELGAHRRPITRPEHDPAAAGLPTHGLRAPRPGPPARPVQLALFDLP